MAERSKAQGANPVGPGFREPGPEGSNPSLSAYFPKRLPIPGGLKLGPGDGLPVLNRLGYLASAFYTQPRIFIQQRYELMASAGFRTALSAL